MSISVLHGASIGGGLLLGLAADHRVATTSASFRLGVTPYGLSPVVMATKVLPTLLGRSFSTKMYVEDISIDAECAVASGIVGSVSPGTQAARRYSMQRVCTGCEVCTPTSQATIENHV